MCGIALIILDHTPTLSRPLLCGARKKRVERGKVEQENHCYSSVGLHGGLLHSSVHTIVTSYHSSVDDRLSWGWRRRGLASCMWPCCSCRCGRMKEGEGGGGGEAAMDPLSILGGFGPCKPCLYRAWRAACKVFGQRVAEVGRKVGSWGRAGAVGLRSSFPLSLQLHFPTTLAVSHSRTLSLRSSMIPVPLSQAVYYMARMYAVSVQISIESVCKRRALPCLYRIRRNSSYCTVIWRRGLQPAT